MSVGFFDPISVFCFPNFCFRFEISAFTMPRRAIDADQMDRGNPKEFLPGSPIALKTTLKDEFPTLKVMCPNDVLASE